MSGPDGGRWFLGIVEAGPAAAFGPPMARLLEGRVERAELIAIKEKSKRIFSDAAEGEEGRLAGLAAYFLAVAAALVHRGETISSRGGDDLETVFLDLAAAAPEPWAGLFRGAAVALEADE